MNIIKLASIRDFNIINYIVYGCILYASNVANGELIKIVNDNLIPIVF
jgi:hypothetical protein